MSSDMLSRAVDHEMAVAMSTFINSAETTSSETSNLGGDGDLETPASNSSACGWFVCDEPTTATRFFSIQVKITTIFTIMVTEFGDVFWPCRILTNLSHLKIFFQGSESMASWKANLRFQPTPFESSASGVMVHKGVYEVAKSLYDQMLPLVQSHMAAYGKRARISFTGHSLGGSLAVLLSLMFRYRGVVPVSALNQVYTFGAPSVLNGGNDLLKQLGFSPRHVQSVVIARDLVPRIFSSDIPEQIVEVLKRVNQNFCDLPTFINQVCRHSIHDTLFSFLQARILLRTMIALKIFALECVQEETSKNRDLTKFLFFHFAEATVHHNGPTIDSPAGGAASAWPSAPAVWQRSVPSGSAGSGRESR